jgi:glycosyltransferase involved in cell wall biosynthesis
MSFGAIQSPLVSVIVINHNYGRFLSDCLNSIANQTYPYIECIVVDNASTDDSLTVIAEAKARHFNEDDRRLSVIRMETNIFQTPAAVEGFKHAHGSFIIFFDADDYMLPTCVEAHIRAMLYLRAPVGATCVDYFMSRDRELVTSTCSMDFVKTVATPEKTPSRYFRRVEIPSTSRTGNDLDLDPLELHFVDRKAYGWPWTGTSALCFRRELVELLFQRTPSLKAHLDAYLIGGINCLTGSVLIDRPLAVYRQHATNIFAANPLLNNFYFFDQARQERAQTTAQDEIVKTFAAVSGELATRLLRRRIFIDAIATLATIWSGPPRLPRASNYVIAFLGQNKSVLLKSFGRPTYMLWIMEFTMKALFSFQLKSFFKGLKLLVSLARMTN